MNNPLLHKLNLVESLISSKNPDSATNSKIAILLVDIRDNLESKALRSVVESEINKLIISFEKNKPLVAEALNFLHSVKVIYSNITLERLPLGLTKRGDLSRIYMLITSALSRAVDIFEKRFDRKLPSLLDTKVFIVGSRARGYSMDTKSLFSPGRDVDILLVGDGIFQSEIDYIKLAGFKRDADRFEKNGFIEGYDRRFVPPFLSEACKDIGNIFSEGDKKLFGARNKVLVNVHIARAESGKVRDTLLSGIECYKI